MSVCCTHVDAIVHLEDLSTIRNESSILAVLRKLSVESEGSRNEFYAEEMLLVYELEGICRGIHKKVISRLNLVNEHND